MFMEQGFQFPKYCEYGREVKRFLNENCHYRIGRDGKIRWPPRSQVPSPLDFYLCDNHKVHQTIKTKNYYSV